MIRLHDIYIEGFGSIIKPITYRLDSPGLNMIVGVNGAGKTTILNALAWCGWKQLLKKGSSFEPWPSIIKGTDYRGTKVILNFSDNKHAYQIIRCNEYKGKVGSKMGDNRLIVMEDGVEKVGANLRDKNDYQKWIVEKLGYTFSLFKSTVLFGQELKRLMQESGPDKKAIFDEAFESTFISRAKDMVDVKLKTLRLDHNNVKHKLDLCITRKDSLTNQIEQLNIFLTSFNDTKERDLAELRGEIKKLKGRLKEQTALLLKGPPEKYQKRVLGIKEKIAYITSNEVIGIKDREFKVEMGLAGAKAELAGLKVSLKAQMELRASTAKCPQCQTPFIGKKAHEYKEHLNRVIEQIEKNIEQQVIIVESCQKEFDNTIKLLKAQEKGMAEKVELQKKLIKNINRYNGSLEITKEVLKLGKDITKLRKKYAQVKSREMPHNNMAELTTQLKERRKELKSFKSEIKSINRDIKINQWLVNEPLSNSGLKAFIFNSMLNKVNAYLANYTQLVGFAIKVYIDMQSSRKDIGISVFKGDDEVPYEDLSKGQKQLTDVAIAFALNDTITDIKPINLLLMDEIFESLSPENIETVGNIIIKKSQHKSIHLITHQNSFNPLNARKIYIQQTGKGQSSISNIH